jgi:hypothetical protein
VYRTLLRFDLSTLTGSTLTSATLSQYASSVQAANVSFTVCRLTHAAWTETGATWSTYDGTHAWASLGGDYTTTDPACVSFTGPSTTGAFNVTVTGLAQDALAHRGEQLQMLIKRVTETGTDYYLARSREDATNPPYLTVNYTPPPTSTPTTTSTPTPTDTPTNTPTPSEIGVTSGQWTYRQQT